MTVGLYGELMNIIVRPDLRQVARTVTRRSATMVPTSRKSGWHTVFRKEDDTPACATRTASDSKGVPSDLESPCKLACDLQYEMNSAGSILQKKCLTATRHSCIRRGAMLVCSGRIQSESALSCASDPEAD